MTDIWNYFSTWPVLKWIILVLIAGFIGQFGKMLAQAIIKKIQLARLKKQNPAAIETLPIKEQSAQSNAPDGRIDKKALKILAKLSKKESKKNK
jgi:hypothetical protein